MLAQLPIEDVRQIMQDWNLFDTRVTQAASLLSMPSDEELFAGKEFALSKIGKSNADYKEIVDLYLANLSAPGTTVDYRHPNEEVLSKTDKRDCVDIHRDGSLSVHIKVNSQCQLLGVFKTFCQKYFRPRVNTLAQNDRSFGGHPCSGTIRNALQADVSEPLLARMIKTMIRGESSTVIHVGSKFKRMHGQWNRIIDSFVQVVANSVGVPDLPKALRDAQ
jgi:hypothetical protein